MRCTARLCQGQQLRVRAGGVNRWCTAASRSRRSQPCGGSTSTGNHAAAACRSCCCADRRACMGPEHGDAGAARNDSASTGNRAAAARGSCCCAGRCACVGPEHGDAGAARTPDKPGPRPGRLPCSQPSSARCCAASPDICSRSDCLGRHQQRGCRQRPDCRACRRRRARAHQRQRTGPGGSRGPAPAAADGMVSAGHGHLLLGQPDGERQRGRADSHCCARCGGVPAAACCCHERGHGQQQRGLCVQRHAAARRPDERPGGGTWVPAGVQAVRRAAARAELGARHAGLCVRLHRRGRGHAGGDCAGSGRGCQPSEHSAAAALAGPAARSRHAATRAGGRSVSGASNCCTAVTGSGAAADQHVCVRCARALPCIPVRSGGGPSGCSVWLAVHLPCRTRHLRLRHRPDDGCSERCCAVPRRRR